MNTLDWSSTAVNDIEKRYFTMEKKYFLIHIRHPWLIQSCNGVHTTCTRTAGLVNLARTHPCDQKSRAFEIANQFLHIACFAVFCFLFFGARHRKRGERGEGGREGGREEERERKRERERFAMRRHVPASTHTHTLSLCTWACALWCLRVATIRGSKHI